MTGDQRQAILKEARSWIGTPFRHAARIKGRKGGVDCAQFLIGVYLNVGLLSAVNFDLYVMQWMLHKSEEIYIDQLLSYTQEIEAEDAQPGDIVVFRVGRAYSHGALLVEPWQHRIIHSVNRPAGRGVCIADARNDGGLLSEIKRHRDHPPRFFTVTA